ncbi:MAG: hypothetical protein HC926_06030 [Synechococcaceae cyanobacterium SM2_3_60]|nr:hypothetical protein [Synechococcaceae cyanobacterium SM2_3_60]
MQNNGTLGQFFRRSYASANAKATHCKNELCEGIGVHGAAGGVLTSSSLSPNEGSLLAGGIVLMLVYSIGTVSGAHINPMVSLAFALSGRFSRRQCWRYVIAQSVGAIAIGLLFAVFDFRLSPPQAPLWWPGLPLEAILTSCLVATILRLASSDCRLCPDTRPVVGIVVGITVAVLARWGSLWGVGLMNPLLLIPASVLYGDLRALAWVLLADGLGILLAVAFSRLTPPT